MHILLVEDDEQLSRPLCRSLERHGYLVDVAADGARALAVATDERYDLLILDLGLPDMDGLEVCRQVRAAWLHAPILMLTARDEVEDRVNGLDAGADDYLGKPFALTELLARVRALARRPPPQEILAPRDLADLRLDVSGRRAWRGDRFITFSVREYALLDYLLRHRGQVLTREQILAAVWPYDFEGSDTIVDTYIHYLRDKIDAGADQRLVHTIRGVGYVLRAD